MSKIVYRKNDDIDEVFKILAKTRRRRLLVSLLSADSLTETDLVAQSDSDGENLLEIRHTDLPKLSRAGFIRWEQDSGVIRRGARFNEIEPLVEWCATQADSLSGDLSD